MKLVYISTPLSSEKFKLEDITNAILKHDDVFAFIPPTGQLVNKISGGLLDASMIDKCDEVWVFGRIGRDCSWEIGYAQGKGKLIRFFVTEDNRDILLEDWMLHSRPIIIEEIK